MTSRNQNRSSPSAIPHAPEIEEAVLGAVMLDAPALYEVDDLLTVDSFYLPKHRKMWAAITHLLAGDDRVDISTVADELERRGELVVCGGRAGVVDVADSVFTSANIKAHARLLLDQQKRRTFQRVCQETLGRLNESPDDLLSHFESEVLAIGEVGRGQERTTDEQINAMIAADVAVLSGKDAGLEWPIPELTRSTRGIQPGKIYLIIGLYKTGKSKLAIAAIRHLIECDGAKCLFLSLEMGASQVFRWLAGNALEIDTSFFGTTRLSEQQMIDAHHWVMQHVGEGRLIVDDRAVQTPQSICSAMRRAVIKHKTRVVFIDYLQRIQWADGPVALSDIARGMNLIASTAKRLGVVVVGLSQVPKSVEKQPQGKLINLGDVKDAAVFAEVADCAIAITDTQRNDEVNSGPQRYLKFLIQQRDGESRVLDIQADLRYGRFVDLVNPVTRVQAA